jgi:putative copper resistance protein D
MAMVAPRVRSSPVWPVLFGVGLLAGVTAAGLGALSLAEALTATGLPNPGPVTNYGLPFVRAGGEIAAVLAAGSFMFAAFLVPPQDNGVLDASGYRALRLGAVASGIWTVCAALLVPLTVSDVTGQPVSSRLSPSAIWSVADLVNTAGAWRWTALLAAAVTIASIPVLRWSWTPVLLAGSLITLIPLGLSGHSSAGGSHDLATNSLLIHLFAAALWAGGLLALLAHALRAGAHADLATRRFSAVALWCFVAMALSGVVNALVRIRLADLFDSGYGWLIVAKATALCALGVVGWRHSVSRWRLAGRRRHRHRTSSRPSRRSRSAMTSRDRPRWPACCSIGASIWCWAPRPSCSRSSTYSP